MSTSARSGVNETVMTDDNDDGDLHFTVHCFSLSEFSF